MASGVTASTTGGCLGCLSTALTSVLGCLQSCGGGNTTLASTCANICNFMTIVRTCHCCVRTEVRGGELMMVDRVHQVQGNMELDVMPGDTNVKGGAASTKAPPRVYTEEPKSLEGRVVSTIV